MVHFDKIRPARSIFRFLLITIPLFIVSCQQENPEIIMGVIDLKGWDFDEDGTVDSTLENPMNVSYEQAERQYLKLFENITRDSLLKRNVRSTGLVGTRFRK